MNCLPLFYSKKDYMIDPFLRHRIHLPDICLTGRMYNDARKIYCQEGALYGSTKQERRNTQTPGFEDPRRQVSQRDMQSSRKGEWSAIT